jgi:hypothetical protein
MKHAIIALIALVLALPARAQNTSQDSVALLFKMLKEMQLQLQQANSQMTQSNMQQSTAVETLSRNRQDDALRIGMLQDSLMSSSKRLSDALALIKAYQQQIGKLETKQEKFSETELRLRMAEELKYNHIKENLLNSADLFKLLNTRLNTLGAFKQQGSYQNILKDLNNPANNSLGFSYNEKVFQLVEKTLPADKEKPRILQMAKLLIESPVVSTIKSVAPVISTAHSLMSFLSTISLGNKDLSQEKLDAFKQELERYTLYYAMLNESNARFEITLGTYQSEIEALHYHLQEQSVLNATAMGLSVKSYNGGSTGTYLNELYKTYGRQALEKYFKDLEAKNKRTDGSLDYGAILKTEALQNMYTRTEEAMHLYRDFEKVYKQYLKIVSDNHTEVANILEKAKEMKIGQTGKIKDQVDALNKAKDATVLSISDAIDLSSISEIASKLSKFPPTL